MYKHTKTDKYHKIEYRQDGVARAVFLPLDAPDSVLGVYLKKITQAKQPAAAPGDLEAAIATA